MQQDLLANGNYAQYLAHALTPPILGAPGIMGGYGGTQGIGPPDKALRNFIAELTAIQQTSAGGSTSLYNAIYISLKELAKMKTGADEDVRRQALVLFSDGEDTSSLISFDEVLELAKRSETAIFTIALRGADTQSKGFHEAEFVMRQLAQETGGRSFFPSKLDDLNGVYAEIADELASQYTLGYSSKNAKRDGAYRRIVVQIDRPNVMPRTKRGYYAPTSR